MANDLSLSADFPGGDETKWQALVDKVLKGAPADGLITKTEHGVAVKPLYRSPDWTQGDASGLPGQAPFTRGAKAINNAWLPWDIRQVVNHPDPLIAAEHVMEALTGGVSSVELRVDASGEQGVIARSASDLRRVLDGVKLDLAGVALEAAGATSFHGVELAALLAEAAGPNPDAMLDFNIDPIGTLARTGGLGGTAAAELAMSAGVARDILRAYPKAHALRADARPVHEAGGTEVQELAFLIGAGADYMRALITAGAGADEASRAILFAISVGADYQVNIAKLRAARRLWAQVAQAFGTTSGGPAMQAVSSRRMISRRDPWVNMLRNTAACFAAGVGGAEIVTVRPFTDAIGLPSKLARRIARNTHIIAQEESSLGKVMDAAGGAWTFEKLSEDLAQAAWALFQQIEREGGLTQALIAGGFQGGVADARQKRIKAVARRKEWVTGVNDFPLIEEMVPEVETADLSAIIRRAPEASGRTPADRSWTALLAAARDSATLADLSRPGDAGAEAEPLWPIRLSEPFERLRDIADARSVAGRAPKIFLAGLGPLAEHSPRLTFAQNFFAAGGIEAVPAVGAPEEIAAAFKASGCTLACICGSDKRYADEAAAAATSLTQAGAGRIYLAGRGGELEQTLRNAGIAEFIHVGVDLVASLEQAHAELGLSA